MTTTTSYSQTRLAAIAAVVALALGTAACDTTEGGDENHATDHRTGNVAPSWTLQAGDPLSPDGAERWGLLRYCPGSACVRTPDAHLPAELRLP